MKSFFKYIADSLKPILPIAIIVISVFLYIKFYVKPAEKLMHEKLIGVETAYKQLSDSMAESKIVYQKAEETIKKADKQIAEALKIIADAKEKLKIVNSATYTIAQEARKSDKADVKIIDSENGATIIHELRYDNGPAIGYIMISPEGKFTSKLYKSEYSAKTIISRDDTSGKYRIISGLDYVLKSPSINLNGEANWVNKPYPLNITNGVAYIDPIESGPKEKFIWWSPKVHAMTSLTGFGIGVSTSAYGKSLVDQKYRFLQLGILKDYNENDYSLTFIPVLFRPFENILSNTYVGTGLRFGGESTNLMFSLQIGL